MARLVVTFPDRFFFVDSDKHSNCIEICILYFKYPTSKTMMSIFEGSEPPEGAPPTSGLLLESHLNLPASEIRNLAFLYMAAAVFKVSCEIKNSAIKKMTVVLI